MLIIFEDLAIFVDSDLFRAAAIIFSILFALTIFTEDSDSDLSGYVIAS